VRVLDAYSLPLKKVNEEGRYGLNRGQARRIKKWRMLKWMIKDKE